MPALLLLTASGFGVRSANAADLPNLKEPAFVSPAPAAYDWTGFYVGVNGGYGTDHFAFDYTYVTPLSVEKAASGIDSHGALFGGQVGYNYQLSDLPFIGHAVVGVEADFDWSGIGGSTHVTTPLAEMLATLEGLTLHVVVPVRV